MSIEYPVQSDKSKVQQAIKAVEGYMLGIKHLQKCKKKNAELYSQLIDNQNKK